MLAVSASTYDVRSLGRARIAIGALFLLRTTPLLYVVPGLFANHGGPLFGWPSPGWRVAYAGLVLPDLAVKALCIVRTIAALFFMLGVRARIAGIVACVSGYVVFAQEPFAFIFTLHVLYTSTLLLAIGDGANVLALRPGTVRSPASSVWLVRAFVVSIYAWSAIAKMSSTWLSGATLQAFHDDGYATGAIADALLGSHAMRVVAAWTTMLVEATLGPLLLWRPTRALAILVACSLHALLELTMHPDVFGWEMVALLMVFWPSGRARDHLPTT